MVPLAAWSWWRRNKSSFACTPPPPPALRYWSVDLPVAYLNRSMVYIYTKPMFSCYSTRICRHRTQYRIRTLAPAADPSNWWPLTDAISAVNSAIPFLAGLFFTNIHCHYSTTAACSPFGIYSRQAAGSLSLSEPSILWKSLLQIGAAEQILAGQTQQSKPRQAGDRNELCHYRIGPPKLARDPIKRTRVSVPPLDGFRGMSPAWGSSPSSPRCRVQGHKAYLPPDYPTLVASFLSKGPR